jgi:DNA-binding MarR family transcriptional regulator
MLQAPPQQRRGGNVTPQTRTAEPGTAPAGGGSAVDAVEHELGILIRRARSIAVETARGLHPELDPAAYSLLVHLNKIAPARPTDLAAYFGIGKATVSRQLKLLENLGLIGREPDPADRRAHLLVLTPDGRHRLQRVQAARQQRLRALLGSWPEQDVRDLARSLARLNTLGFVSPDEADSPAKRQPSTAEQPATTTP